MASMALVSPGPKMEITMMASRIGGKASRMSTKRMSSRSTQPPKKPDTAPVGRPISVPMPTEIRPMVSEMRAPKRQREKTSRPSGSVPNQCSADGPRRLDAEIEGVLGVGRHERRGHGHHGERQHHRETDDASLVLQEAADGGRPGPPGTLHGHPLRGAGSRQVVSYGQI